MVTQLELFSTLWALVVVWFLLLIVIHRLTLSVLPDMRKCLLSYSREMCWGDATSNLTKENMRERESARERERESARARARERARTRVRVRASERDREGEIKEQTDTKTDRDRESNCFSCRHTFKPTQKGIYTLSLISKKRVCPSSFLCYFKRVPLLSTACETWGWILLKSMDIISL